MPAAQQAIGGHGAEGMLRATAGANGDDSADRRLRVLTHCNTGALATAAYGTALGVVRALAERGRLEHTYCTETRPYNQGASLNPLPPLEVHRPANSAASVSEPGLSSLPAMLFDEILQRVATWQTFRRSQSCSTFYSTYKSSADANHLH